MKNVPTLLEEIRSRLPFMDGQVENLSGRLNVLESKVSQLEAVSTNTKNSILNLNSRVSNAENNIRNVMNTLGTYATKTEVTNVTTTIRSYIESPWSVPTGSGPGAGYQNGVLGLLNDMTKKVNIADIPALVRDNLNRLLSTFDMGLSMVSYGGGLSRLQDILAGHKGFLDKFLNMAKGNTTPLRALITNLRDRFAVVRDRVASIRDKFEVMKISPGEIGSDFEKFRDWLDKLRVWRDTYALFGIQDYARGMASGIKGMVIGGPWWMEYNEPLVHVRHDATFNGIKGRLDRIGTGFSDLRDAFENLRVDMSNINLDFNNFRDYGVRNLEW